MRPQCVDPVCTNPIEPGWDFCPACGTDNRPPRERRPVPHHYHRWLARQGFCIRCGEPADEPYSFGRRTRLWLGGTCVAAAATALLTLGFIRLGLALPATRLGEIVNSWYLQEVYHRRGRYSSYRYTTLLGDDVSLWLGIGGIVLGLIGAWMLLKLPAPESSDDPPGRWM